jgi:hypothetical protein
VTDELLPIVWLRWPFDDGRLNRLTRPAAWTRFSQAPHDRRPARLPRRLRNPLVGKRPPLGKTRR